jgi:enterochelin esterase-like enzyme
VTATARLVGTIVAVAALGPFVVAALGAFASGAGALTFHDAALTFHDADGIRVISTSRIDSRLLELTVRTPALAGPAKVRVLLPSGYASSRRRRYPVLYLLHGTSGGAADWTAMGHAEQVTAHEPLIVVMPDIALQDDGGGWCTNWFNGGAGGKPQWETVHIDQLIPWIDHNLATIATRSGRAIAGLSQGGFCSMSYAARHPDLFGIALSFSGAPDIAFGASGRGAMRSRSDPALGRVGCYGADGTITALRSTCHSDRPTTFRSTGPVAVAPARPSTAPTLRSSGPADEAARAAVLRISEQGRERASRPPRADQRRRPRHRRRHRQALARPRRPGRAGRHRAGPPRRGRR